MAFRSHVLFPMVFADVRPQRHSVLDLLVAEGTVEGETVDVIALNVLPVMRIVKSIPRYINSFLTSRDASFCPVCRTWCRTTELRHLSRLFVNIDLSVS